MDERMNEWNFRGWRAGWMGRWMDRWIGGWVREKGAEETKEGDVSALPLLLICPSHTQRTIDPDMLGHRFLVSSSQWRLPSPFTAALLCNPSSLTDSFHDPWSSVQTSPSGLLWRLGPSVPHRNCRRSSWVRSVNSLSGRSQPGAMYASIFVFTRSSCLWISPYSGAILELEFRRF